MIELSILGPGVVACALVFLVGWFLWAWFSIVELKARIASNEKYSNEAMTKAWETSRRLADLEGKK